MEIKELTREGLDLKLMVSIPAREFEQSIERKVRDIAKTEFLKGFRKGHAPIHVVKKKYYDPFRREVLSEFMQNALKDIQAGPKALKLATSPQIAIVQNEEGKDIIFNLECALVPEILMPQWDQITVERPALNVTDNDIDEYLNILATRFATFEKETKGKAKKGDQVTFDAVGSIDGVAIDRLKLSEQKLVLGDTRTMPGFDEQLIGAKTGETATVKIYVPASGAATGGTEQEAIFECQIKAVHTPTKPKIDDDFAQRFKLDSVAKLREASTKTLRASYEGQVLILMKQSLFDQLERVIHFDVPQSLLAKEREIVTMQIEQFGPDEFEEIKDKSQDAREEYYHKLAIRRVRLGLLFKKYNEQEGLQLSAGDIQQAINQLASGVPTLELRLMEDYRRDPKVREAVLGPALENKAVKDIFAKKVKVIEKEYEKKELEKLLQ